MQAEAEKRKSSEFPNVLRGACGEIVAVKVDDMEWQPDWSQAPRCDVVAWDINEHGQARWIASDNGYYLAPSFDYTGDWRDSLRKRPN